jgi:hypothetical protein
MHQTEFRKESLEIAQRLNEHVRGKGVTLAQFATAAWVLAHRGVSSVIAGPRSLAQWQAYAPAVHLRGHAGRRGAGGQPGAGPATRPRRDSPTRRIRLPPRR